MPTSKSRRVFLGASAAVAARSAMAGFPANETINIACIGTGGRCRHLMQGLQKIPTAKVIALCDVWDEAAAKAKPLADKNAETTRDFRRVLARRDVDAVLIATPDHWHAPLVLEALAAGKDVYCEKPLTHKPGEGQALINANAVHRRVVQVGTQQRSMPHIQEAKKIVEEGKLGRIFRADLTWNRNIGRGEDKYEVNPSSVDWRMFLGNAPLQAFNPYKMREWRWFWDFGGGLFTDLMVHWIDVVHWLVSANAPDFALSFGDFIHAAGRWETPDTVQTLLHYRLPPSGSALQAHYEGTFSNAFRGAMTVLMGTEATLYIDRGRYEFIPERMKPGRIDKILSKKPTNRGADFYDEPDGEKLHLENWLSCVKSRKPTTAPIEAGVLGAEAAQLANAALRFGGMARRA